MPNISKFNVGGTTYDLAGLALIAPVQTTLIADILYNEGDQQEGFGLRGGGVHGEQAANRDTGFR